jgi:hypothetical protein
MAATEKQIAEHILQKLKIAQYTGVQAAMPDVEMARAHLGSGEGVEQERAEAWLAVSALHQALSKSQRNQGLEAHWEKAIDKLLAWIASLK